MKTVYVITPTVGSPELIDCIRSVSEQSYNNIVHLLVVDGQSREENVKAVVERVGCGRTRIMTIPWNTGGTGYLGHIVYSSVSRLVLDGYVSFLDEDNFFDANHIESCVELLERFDLAWCYSLRKIVDSAGSVVCNDDCDSLGIWPGFDGCYNLIDINCFLFGLEVLGRNVDLLRRLNYVEGETSGDRMLTHSLLNGYERYYVTGAYTVNYRVKSRSNVSEREVLSWFKTGNEIQAQVYKVFPWANFRCKSENEYASSIGFCRKSIGEKIPKLADVWERNYRE